MKGEREFRRSLQIALGSAAELEYQLITARDLGYLDVERHTEFERRVTEIRKMLTAFINTIDRSLGDQVPAND